MSNWDSNYSITQMTLQAEEPKGAFVLPEAVVKTLWAVARSTPDKLIDSLHPEIAAQADEEFRLEVKQELVAAFIELAEKKFEEKEHPRGPGGVFIRGEMAGGSSKDKKAQEKATKELRARLKALAAAEKEFGGLQRELEDAKVGVEQWLISQGMSPPPRQAPDKYDLTTVKGAMETANKACYAGAPARNSFCDLAVRLDRVVFASPPAAAARATRDKKKAEFTKAQATVNKLNKKMSPKPKAVKA